MSDHRRHKDFVESPEDIAEILDTVSEKVPKMIKGIIGAFFSPEAAKDMAKSVAEFRKTLIEGGIPEDEAMRMTREYMQTVTNWKGMVNDSRSGNTTTGTSNREPLGSPTNGTLQLGLMVRAPGWAIDYSRSYKEPRRQFKTADRARRAP